MFNITGNGKDQRKRAAAVFNSVRQCLIEKFVPHHLEIEHLTQQSTRKQNRNFF